MKVSELYGSPTVRINVVLSDLLVEFTFPKKIKNAATWVLRRCRCGMDVTIVETAGRWGSLRTFQKSQYGILDASRLIGRQ